MNAPDFIKLPPHSVEAEQSLIGGLLLDNLAWHRIGDVVRESDFFRDDHRRIFRHIGKLIQQGQPADVVTVADAIGRSNELDQTGGLGYLGEIANATPSAANIEGYARIVTEDAARRRLSAAAAQIDALAHGRGDARMAIDEAQRLLSEVSDAVSTRSEPVSVGTVLSSVVEDIEARCNSGSSIAGLSTGFVDLDRKLSGLHPGDLVILAGRPAMGKTCLALNIAGHVSVELGRPVLVFSLEMTYRQLATRALSSAGNVSMTRLRNGRLLDTDWDGITNGLGKLHAAPLFIDESSSLTVSDMTTRARRVLRRQGLALIVIDYLQLMRGEGNNRNEELGDITRRLKLMAKALHVPVVVLSQLSRKVEERPNKRPLMSDLRESGAIEQDADVILMVYRDDYYNSESTDAGTGEILIVKQRQGELGDVRLAFQGDLSRFRDLAFDELQRFDHARAEAKMAKSRRGGFDG